VYTLHSKNKLCVNFSTAGAEETLDENTKCILVNNTKHDFLYLVILSDENECCKIYDLCIVIYDTRKLKVCKFNMT
jgi:hypothetical protein